MAYADAVDESFRMAELLGGLSLACDVASANVPEKALRTVVLAVEVGRRHGVAEADLRDTYYVNLLRYLGCVGYAHEEAHVYGAGEGEAAGDEAEAQALGCEGAVREERREAELHAGVHRDEIDTAGVARDDPELLGQRIEREHERHAEPGEREHAQPEDDLLERVARSWHQQPQSLLGNDTSMTGSMPLAEAS